MSLARLLLCSAPTLFVAAVFVSINNRPLQAQTLKQVRAEVRSENSASPATQRDSESQARQRKSRAYLSNRDSDCDDRSDDESLWVQIGTGIIKLPFVLPRAMARDEDFRAGYFRRYPYLHGSESYVTDFAYSERGTAPWLLRLRADYSSDFDSLSYWGGSVLLDTSSRFGIMSDLYYRQEELSVGNDSLWNGDTNIVFRFAQGESLQMRAGAGLNWLADSRDSDFGMNFTYSGDWFPSDPWIVSGELDAGKLGSADFLHLRATVGAQYHRVELFSGYDHVSIGGAKIGGPVFGLRLWY
ncbi:MAG: hypothetical protein AAF483_07850 [Planctomycetota bacterium]